MPDPAIPTEETGTRHRTADRVARQTGYPVISVSPVDAASSRCTSAAAATCSRTPAQILSRANQALATLERYKLRLDEVSGTLSALEIEDLVTVRDVAAVAQRLEMVRRIAREIEDYVVELGTDGRLLSLQLDELVAGVDADRELVVRDYLPDRPPDARPHGRDVLAELEALVRDRAGRPRRGRAGARARRQPSTSTRAVSPRGYRLLAKVPRLPGTVVDRLVEHFGSLQKLLAASIDDLQAVDGVGELAGPQRPRGAVPAGRVAASSSATSSRPGLARPVRGRCFPS